MNFINFFFFFCLAEVIKLNDGDFEFEEESSEDEYIHSVHPNQVNRKMKDEDVQHVFQKGIFNSYD